MRQLWSDNRQEILDELDRLVERRQPISLQGANGHLATGIIRSVVTRAGKPFLVFRRPKRLVFPDLVRHAVYKKDSGPFMIFPLLIDRIHQQLLAAAMPDKIDSLQQRQHPRYRVRHHGQAAFFVDQKARLCQMGISDISLGGACLVGRPRYELNKAGLIGPTTFTILAGQGVMRRSVTISRAEVVRSAASSTGGWEVGIRFLSDKQESSTLRGLFGDPVAAMMFEGVGDSAAPRYRENSDLPEAAAVSRFMRS